MSVIVNLTMILSLAGSPVLAGMIQGQETDEAATCELRGAGMVTRAPENSVVFPQDANCLEAENDSRETPNEDGLSAIDIAGYSSAVGQRSPTTLLAAVVPSVD